MMNCVLSFVHSSLKVITGELPTVKKFPYLFSVELVTSQNFIFLSRADKHYLKIDIAIAITKSNC